MDQVARGGPAVDAGSSGARLDDADGHDLGDQDGLAVAVGAAAGRAGARPSTVAVLSTWPASMSAWVRAWLAVQVTVSPGRAWPAAAGQLTVTDGSLTATPVEGDVAGVGEVEVVVDQVARGGPAVDAEIERCPS